MRNQRGKFFVIFNFIIANILLFIPVCFEIKATNSGLVQLWQFVPSGQEIKEGKTTSQIMNALKCKPNHDFYPIQGGSQHNTYVNSCYVDDALYLGEDSNYYYIYLSGYEGKVSKTKSHYFELDLNNDGKKVQYEIQTVAYFVPDNKLKTDIGGEGASQSEQNISYLQYSTDILDKYNEDDISQGYNKSSGTVQSPSYYATSDGTLKHYITNNVKESGSYSQAIVGKAPEWMKENVKYYSYDGIYFYSDWRDIDVDGKGAINEKNPFYNYYQYLSFRTQSNYSASQIDRYTASKTTSNSKLIGAGKYFEAVNSKYGINGTLQYAMGIHESGWGKSSLSINKNNLFGMNATDNNPYGNGTSFPTVESGINYHADRYLSWGYTDPLSDYRYYGSHVGNKGSGMNVKYASDPFWGEKIAGWYYQFDSSNGNEDYQYYTIGIKQNNSVAPVKLAANTSSTTLYSTKNGKENIKISHYPVIIKGIENDFYEIKTDTPIVNGKAVYSAQYIWDDTNAYIATDSIDIVNGGKTCYYINGDQSGTKGWKKVGPYWYYINSDGKSATGWQKIGYKWYYFNGCGVMQTGWQHIDNKWYYLEESGAMKTGWLEENNQKYYFTASGSMSTGWEEIDNIFYFFNSEGIMQTDWQQINNKWYYFDSLGKMQTGWVDLNNEWYYLDKSGSMKTSWQQINNKLYYFNRYGVMQTGWVEIEKEWYYFNASGEMRTGWLDLNKKWYYLDKSGAMLTGSQKIGYKWYYFNASGVMQSGWVNNNGKCYYFSDSGARLTGWLELDNKWYYLDKTDGFMLTGTHQIGGKWYEFDESGVMQ